MDNIMNNYEEDYSSDYLNKSDFNRDEYLSSTPDVEDSVFLSINTEEE